jgi:hypothetical protein
MSFHEPFSAILFFRILCRHFPAFPGTAAAGFSTLLAMLCFVFGTFITTSFAYIGTNATDFFCAAAAQAHELCSGITDSGTFHIKLNTACHHFYIILLGARGSTMVANGCTIQACIDTGFVNVITSHITVFKREGIRF